MIPSVLALSLPMPSAENLNLSLSSYLMFRDKDTSKRWTTAPRLLRPGSRSRRALCRHRLPFCTSATICMSGSSRPAGGSLAAPAAASDFVHGDHDHLCHGLFAFTTRRQLFLYRQLLTHGKMAANSLKPVTIYHITAVINKYRRLSRWLWWHMEPLASPMCLTKHPLYHGRNLRRSRTSNGMDVGTAEGKAGFRQTLILISISAEASSHPFARLARAASRRDAKNERRCYDGGQACCAYLLLGDEKRVNLL